MTTCDYYRISATNVCAATSRSLDRKPLTSNYIPPARQLDQRRRSSAGDQLDGQNAPSLVITTARTLAGTRPYALIIRASSDGR